MLRVLILAGVLAFLPFLVYSNAAPKRIHGRVVAAPEGDVVILKIVTQHVTVRLAGIDAPQPGQPHSTNARESLSALALDKQVECVEQSRYRHNGIIAFCKVGDVDLSEEQVRRGNAWVYEAYDQLAALQEDARAAKAGLWRDSNPVPPWRW